VRQVSKKKNRMERGISSPSYSFFCVSLFFTYLSKASKPSLT